MPVIRIPVIRTTERIATLALESKTIRTALPLVMLHGLRSTPREFDLIALTLRGRGIQLITPHIDGYSLDPRPRRTSWRQWQAAASAAIGQVVPAVVVWLSVFFLLKLVLGTMLVVPLASAVAAVVLSGLGNAPALFLVGSESRAAKRNSRRV